MSKRMAIYLEFVEAEQPCVLSDGLGNGSRWVEWIRFVAADVF